MAETTISPTGAGKFTHHGARLSELLARLEGDWDGMTAAQQRAFTKEVLEALLVVKIGDSAETGAGTP